ncbi:MAG: hypothetical protein NZL83_03170 [Candidatus Absconditabacterales bacterium]|nr:hypothetical protein [Candidatus Absconditabacterales bacterium]
MIRSIIYILIIILCALPTQAQQERRGRRGTSPDQIFDNVAGKTNEGLRIQETRMNRVDGRGQYPRQYRLANTLDSIRNNLSPYLQWLTYFGLTIATVLIIYNGFLLVSAAGHNNGDVSQVINRFKNIGIGLALLLGFWFVIKLAAIIINALGNQTF